MTEECAQPRDVAIRWFNEVWNNQNSASIGALVAPGAKGHLEGNQLIAGFGEFVAFHRSFLLALPDVEVKIINTLAEGNDVCVLWLATATHTGYGFGFNPTGYEISIRGMTWFHVVGGKITEGWDAWNYDGLFAALAGKAKKPDDV